MENEKCFKTKISKSGKQYFINTEIGISQWGKSLNPSRPYPIGWEYHESKSQKGKIYYRNAGEGITTWDKPQIEKESKLIEGWEAVKSTNCNQTYYLNKIIQKTQWKFPTNSDSKPVTPESFIRVQEDEAKKEASFVDEQNRKMEALAKQKKKEDAALVAEQKKKEEAAVAAEQKKKADAALVAEQKKKADAAAEQKKKLDLDSKRAAEADARVKANAQKTPKVGVSPKTGFDVAAFEANQKKQKELEETQRREAEVNKFKNQLRSVSPPKTPPPKPPPPPKPKTPLSPKTPPPKAKAKAKAKK